MTILVLAKPVPELDELSFDPERRLVLRGASRLLVNPFDQRALAAAGALRRPGERLLVLSMCPPEGHPVLAELFAHGANEVVVVTDPALRGSDSLVTSRVLARAIRMLEADVILAGRFSTDSSTAQLPAQLAEDLGRPLVNQARTLEWAGPGRMLAQSETELGWRQEAVPLPLVVTISERLCKPLKPTPEALQAARERPLRALSLTELGLRPSEVGVEGSPTRVEALEVAKPVRARRLLGEGSIDDRVRLATELVSSRLSSRLASRDSPPPATSAEPRTGSDRDEVIVLASPQTGGLDTEALPLVREVGRQGGGAWTSVVGFGQLSPDARAKLRSAGAAAAYWCEDALPSLPATAAAAWLGAMLERRPGARALLFSSTIWSREVAGRLSSHRGLGLVGDAVRVETQGDGALALWKPSFGGGVLAKVVSRTPPLLATVRPGAFGGTSFGTAEGALPVEELPIDLPKSVVETSEEHLERDPRFGDLDHARVVVGVGMGVGGRENIPRVLDLVRPLGASLAATRRVVDAGWLPTQLQVGLTGRFIAPELYIGVGVSGKDNHMVGVQRARVAIGINPEPKEPLFQHVDAGVVGKWEEVLPPLVRALMPILAGGR